MRMLYHGNPYHLANLTHHSFGCRYKAYATVDPDTGAPEDSWTGGEAVSLVGADTYDPKLFRLSQTSIFGEFLRDQHVFIDSDNLSESRIPTIPFKDPGRVR